jgi:hypothetical protein
MSVRARCLVDWCEGVLLRVPDGVELEVIGQVEDLFNVSPRSPGRQANSLQLMTAQETAHYLRKSRSWVYDHKRELGARRAGEGRGADLFFRRVDLDAWVEAQRA